jgi:hypothetical protein
MHTLSVRSTRLSLCVYAVMALCVDLAVSGRLMRRKVGGRKLAKVPRTCFLAPAAPTHPPTASPTLSHGPHSRDHGHHAHRHYSKKDT